MQQVSYAKYLKTYYANPKDRIVRTLKDWMKELDGRMVIGGRVFHHGHRIEIPECWCVTKDPGSVSGTTRGQTK